MGNKRVGAQMVLNADADQLMESGLPACYHTTVPQRDSEMLHLAGDSRDSALSLGDAILISSDYWAEHAGHVRLAKCQRERESCRG